jgi:hypothetical protein
VWGPTAARRVGALGAGRIAADVAPPESVGVLTAFAGGCRARLARRLGDSRGYAEGGPLVAFATSGGFLVAYALTTLD